VKLLLVGWDAADWKVIRPLLAKGEMPNLAGLMSQGAHGNIATIYPPLSPMLWTSIATGKRPHKHGIHGFVEPTEDGMHVRPITNLGRTTKAFWNILNQHGKRSIVAGWWPSHPAEPIRGAMVSNHFPLSGDIQPGSPMQPGTVYPLELAGELADLRVHPVDITGEILEMFAPGAAQVDQKEDKSLHDLAGIIAETMSIHAAATDLMERLEWDLAAVYYTGIDHFSHRFMRYHAKKRRGRKDAGSEIFAGVVENAYRYHDAMLGRLLQLAGPDCAVMMMSDHGFHSDALLPNYIPAEAAGPAVEHRHFGIVYLRAPGVPAGGQIYGASVLDIAPTVLHLFGIAAGSDMDGKVLTNAFPGQTEKERIPSWDQVPGDDGRHPAAFQYDSAGAAESLQQLVHLGYIAALTEDDAQNVERAVTENRYNLARACLDAGDLGTGAAILTELIAQDPEQGRFHTHLIECRLQQGQLAESRKRLEAFDRACAEMAPRAAEELNRRRAERTDETLKREDKTERGERHKLAEKAQGFVMHRLLLHAQLALAQKRSKEQQRIARAALERLAEMAGASSALAIFLGRGFAEIAEYAKALDYIDRVLKEDPEHWEALGLRARVRFAAKHYQEAAEGAIASLSLVYMQPATHHLLGAALERLGERRQAEQEYRVAVAQMPGLVRARIALARLLRRNPATLGEAAEHMVQANLLRKKTLRNRAAAAKSTEAQVPVASRTLAIWGREGTAPPEDRSTVVTIVSGLPRSGTSMMMQMLASAGIPAYTDDLRAADEDNPRGYFEHKNATLLHKDSSWIPDARGKVVKIVGHLLPHLPPGERYRIVFMHRNLQDVVASQGAMLKRLERRGGRLSGDGLAKAYGSQLVRIEEWLKRAPHVDVLGVSYEQAVSAPVETASRLAMFLGNPFDAPRAAASVEPGLQRQRAAG
jgi:predicted AlkP superfamily phosphohydrolase/phosphomutase/tetratricopeptide (TPR) repeat protein